jgi:hypothetical protein
MERSFRGVLEKDVLHRDEGSLQMCIRTFKSLIADLMSGNPIDWERELTV